jgi:hypothetical protein
MGSALLPTRGSGGPCENASVSRSVSTCRTRESESASNHGGGTMSALRCFFSRSASHNGTSLRSGGRRGAIDP